MPRFPAMLIRNGNAFVYQEGRKGFMKLALTKRTWGLLLVLAVLLALASLPALAADFPVSAVLTLSPDAISGPETVTAQLQVTNISGEDMTSPVSLYDPYGKLVSVFGKGGEAALKKGASMSISAQVAISQAMLDAGEVSYTLRWQSPDGQELAQPVTAAVSYSGEKGNLRVVRTVSPEVVRGGQTVKVVYELTNIGDSTIQTVTVQEKLVKKPKSIRSLAAGDTKSLEFSVKMGNQDLTSGATIKFRVSNGSPEESTVVEDRVIPLAVYSLKANLSTDRSGVDIGESVVLTLTIQNDGNVSYSDVTATDKTLGTVFEGLEVPAGATVTQSKEVQVNGPANYKLTLNLNDNTGKTNMYETNQVQVSAFDPEKELKLTLLLTADKESLVNPPEDVAMTLIVTNTSNVDCKKVEITHAGVKVYTIDLLKAGQSVTVKRDFTVSQPGQFRFTASTKDTVGNNAVFESNTLTLMRARQTPAPTPVPTPTIAPLITLPPASYEDVSQPLRIMRTVLYPVSNVLGVLSALALLLFLVSTVVRFKKRHDSDTAYDHLELAEKRDYAQPAEDSAPPEEPADAPDREEPAQDAPADEAGGELPGDEPAEEPQEEEPSSSPMGQSGGFRMTRDTQTDEFPVYSEAPEKPEYKPRRAQRVEKMVDDLADEAEDTLADAREEVTGWRKAADAVRDTAEEAAEKAEDTVREAGQNNLPDRRRRSRNKK